MPRCVVAGWIPLRISSLPMLLVFLPGLIPAQVVNMSHDLVSLGIANQNMAPDNPSEFFVPASSGCWTLTETALLIAEIRRSHSAALRMHGSLPGCYSSEPAGSCDLPVVGDWNQSGHYEGWNCSSRSRHRAALLMDSGYDRRTSLRTLQHRVCVRRDCG